MTSRSALIRAFLLASVLLLALPAVMRAQFTFTTNNGAITITGYTGSNGVVMIPSTIGGLPVTSVGDWAFYASSVTNVLIPDTVSNVGDGAFFNCESLTNVTLGNSISNIGDWAFGFCPSLISVCCRGNTPSLGGGNVFYGNLATIYYLSGATGWGPVLDGHPAVLWNPAVPYNYTINSDSITLTITKYTGSDSTAIIPNSINFLPVTSIGIFAFFNCNLTSATIPNSVANISEDAFRESASLTNVTFGNGLISIGAEAFGGCSSITSLTFPSSLNNIDEYGFEGCNSLTSIYFTGNAPAIDTVVFANNPTTVYYLPGTTGWNIFNANSELNPAELWLPQVLTNDGSFGLQSNGFGFSINWASGQTVVVEGCTNLVNPVWVPLTTNTLIGTTSYFSDPQWTNYPSRYYRLSSP
jgi:hypothetical protein